MNQVDTTVPDVPLPQERQRQRILKKTPVRSSSLRIHPPRVDYVVDDPPLSTSPVLVSPSDAEANTNIKVRRRKTVVTSATYAKYPYSRTRRMAISPLPLDSVLTPSFFTPGFFHGSPPPSPTSSEDSRTPCFILEFEPEWDPYLGNTAKVTVRSGYSSPASESSLFPDDASLFDEDPSSV